MQDCELCRPAEVAFENELAYARPDNNALSRGHMLVVPKRHVADFFGMSAEEQAAVLRLRATRATCPTRAAGFAAS